MSARERRKRGTRMRLLAGGSRALEALFPGIRSDLLKAGALKGRAGPRRPIRAAGFRSVPAARPRLRRLLSLPAFARERLPAATRAKSPTSSSAIDRASPTSRRRLIGAKPSHVLVRGRRREAAQPSRRIWSSTLPGAPFPTMSLLDKLDPSGLEVTEIGIDQAYATAMFEIPPSRSRAWMGLAHLRDSAGAEPWRPDPPNRARALDRLDRQSSRRRSFPGEIEGFKAFVKAFRTPTFFDAINGRKTGRRNRALQYARERPTAFRPA